MCPTLRTYVRIAIPRNVLHPTNQPYDVPSSTLRTVRTRPVSKVLCLCTQEHIVPPARHTTIVPYIAPNDTTTTLQLHLSRYATHTLPTRPPSLKGTTPPSVLSTHGYTRFSTPYTCHYHYYRARATAPPHTLSTHGHTCLSMPHTRHQCYYHVRTTSSPLLHTSTPASLHYSDASDTMLHRPPYYNAPRQHTLKSTSLCCTCTINATMPNMPSHLLASSQHTATYMAPHCSSNSNDTTQPPQLGEYTSLHHVLAPANGISMPPDPATNSAAQAQQLAATTRTPPHHTARTLLWVEDLVLGDSYLIDSSSEDATGMSRSR
ncbi:hypothetical protein Pcinc_007821 [Petrolisthes cinctipes]|uniref:Uncharacterized protein n=1 Tax=Petrolisthes cinctipes TaxID=88211 RepID=A0AAE1GA82_PETCI|nr:hypothetical protein Pcinc_007821 [Petrolisthes cinctipes]